MSEQSCRRRDRTVIVSDHYYGDQSLCPYYHIMFNFELEASGSIHQDNV